MTHISTIAFIFVVLFFLWRGYQRGLVKSIIRILSIVVGYVASFFLTFPFAKIITKYFEVEGLITYLISGILVFFAISALVNHFGNKLFKKDPKQEESKVSKSCGAALGLVIGCIIGFLTVYLINFKLAQNSLTASSSVAIPLAAETENLNQHGRTQISTVVETMPQNQDSFIDRSAKKLVGQAASATVDLTTKDSTTAQVTKMIAKDPQAAIEMVKRVSNDGQVVALMSDPKIQEILNRGNLNELISNPRFRVLMKNNNMQIVANKLGSGSKSEQIIGNAMIKGWKRVNAIKNDSRVVAILEDPEFQQQLAGGDTLTLLRSPKFKTLIEITFTGDQIASN